jgi:hypothetical protein
VQKEGTNYFGRKTTECQLMNVYVNHPGKYLRVLEGGGCKASVEYTKSKIVPFSLTLNTCRLFPIDVHDIIS